MLKSTSSELIATISLLCLSVAKCVCHAAAPAQAYHNMHILWLSNDINHQSLLQRLTVAVYKQGTQVAFAVLHVDSLLLLTAEP